MDGYVNLLPVTTPVSRVDAQTQARALEVSQAKRLMMTQAAARDS